MNAFELNKVIGAILGALVFVMGLSVLSDIIFHEPFVDQPAYQIAIVDASADGAEAAPEVSFDVLLASADPAAGERAARVCSACHTFTEGGANGVGPNLYAVVDRPVAGHEGFNYSPAMVAHAEEAPTWTYAELDGFLHDPQGWIPGTLMGYAGIKDDETRANVIAYLRSISPEASPLPEPEAAPAEVAAVDATETATDATAAPAEGAAVPAEGAAAPAEGAAVPAEGAAAAPAANVDPFTQLVAAADPAVGQGKGAVCIACHSIEAGAPPKLGPNLHGVYGRAVAGSPDYNYTDAMKRYAADAGTWTIEHLSNYLHAPMEVVPGTRMAYAGVKDDNDRAAVIAWLHSISPEAGPIVPAAAPVTAEAAAPAEGAPAAAPAEGAPAEATPAATPAEGAPAAPAQEAPAAVETQAAPAGGVEPTAAPAQAGVEDAQTTGGEGAAPAAEVSAGAPAATSAATAGETIAPLTGQTTEPTGATEPGLLPSLSPPAANTQLPPAETNPADSDAAPAAAEDSAAGELEALPDSVSLEGAGGREDPTMADGAAAGVAKAAAEEMAEDQTEVSEEADAAMPTEGETAPEGTAPAAATPAAPAPAVTTPAPPAPATTTPAAPAPATAVPAAPAGDGASADQAQPSADTAESAASTGTAAPAAASPAATDDAATTTATPAPANRSNVVIHPAGEANVEIINPRRAGN